MKEITEGYFFGEWGPLMWSDCWQIIEDDIWFTSAEMNALFRMNRITGETMFVSRIPVEQFLGFRQYPGCLKQGDLIFCLPNNADKICCYHIIDDSWRIIEIANPDYVRLECLQAWCFEGKLYVVSVGLKQLIELDISRLCIDQYYDLTDEGQEIALRGVFHNTCIYTMQRSRAGICRFDCRTKEKEIYLLHQVEDELSRIAFDGRRFWLGGKKKKIYVWDCYSEELRILDQFPEGFGIYDFANRKQPLLDCNRGAAGNWMFIDIRYAGSYVWLIPCDANEILYVDIHSLEIRKFPIENENRTEEDMKEPLMRCMYILDYVREGRYLGVFSLKNKWMYEIDTEEMVYRVIDCRLEERSARRIQRMYRAEVFLKKMVHQEEKEDTLSNLIEVLTDTYC